MDLKAKSPPHLVYIFAYLHVLRFQRAYLVCRKQGKLFTITLQLSKRMQMGGGNLFNSS